MPDKLEELEELLAGNPEAGALFAALMESLEKGGKTAPPEEEEEEEEAEEGEAEEAEEGEEEDDTEKGKVCAKCGANLRKSAAFCSDCGESFLAKCPGCEAELAKGFNLCPYCGEALHKSLMDEMSVDPDLSYLMQPDGAIMGADVFVATSQAMSDWLSGEFRDIHGAIEGIKKSLATLGTTLGTTLEKSLTPVSNLEAMTSELKPLPALTEEDRSLLKSVSEGLEILGKRPRPASSYAVEGDPRNGTAPSDKEIWGMLKKGIDAGVAGEFDVFLWESRKQMKPGLLQQLETLTNRA